MLHKNPLPLVLLIFIFSSCQHKEYAEIISSADNLLWANPDSCINYCIEMIDSVSSTDDQMILSLIYEHAQFKINRSVESDSTLHELEEYFDSHRDHRHLGEIYYILGTNYSLDGIYRLGTTYLKKAEECYSEATNTPAILWGMLYFQFGCMSQDERLYTIARDYYEKAICYFRVNNHYSYLASAYLRLAFLQEVSKNEISIMYVDSALYYASKLENPMQYKEAEIGKYYHICQMDTDIIRDNILYLCDSCGLYSYASDLVEYLLDKQNYNEARLNMDRLANDTSYNTYSKEKYYLYKAQLQQIDGNYKEAYHTLEELYQWLILDIESSSYDRIYTITQKYEATKQQELFLQEKIKKQKAYSILLILIIACLIAGEILYIRHKRGQDKLRQSEEQKKELKHKLEKNQLVLKTRIREQIYVARHLYQWASKTSEELPDVLDILSPRKVRYDSDNWKSLYENFNICYNNLLHKLKSIYPDLSDTDMQYIALTYMDFSATDICFLMGVSNRTLWNRRSTVKQHLGMADEEDLDTWIHEQGEIIEQRCCPN